MSSNSTADASNSGPPVWFDVLRTALLSAAVFFIVTGNVFCFFVIRSSRQMRKVSRIFLVSLIVADLCTGVFSGGALLATVAVGHRIPEPGAEVLCKVYFMCGILFNGGSFISLLTLICDCYIAIEKPLRYPSLLTARRAYNITWSFWILMLSVVTAYGVYFGTLPHHKKEWHWCLVEVSPLKNESYILMLLVYTSVTVILPLAATFGLYTRIRLIVHRHKVRLARITPAGHPSHQRSNDTKSLTTFLIVNCGAALTSLPMSVLLVYSYWTRDFSMYGLSAAIMLRTCNNLLHVLVHTKRNGEFRATAGRILGLCRSRDSREKSGGPSANNTQLSSIASALG